MAAFYVPVSMGICWAHGVWGYTPYFMHHYETCAVIFLQITGEDDVVFTELLEDVGFEL